MVKMNESYITFKNKISQENIILVGCTQRLGCLRESGILHSLMFLVCLRINKLVGRDFQKHKLQPCGRLPWFLQVILTGFLMTRCFLCSSPCWCSGWCGSSGSKDHGLLRALSLVQSNKLQRWEGETLAQERGWFAFRARPGADCEPELTTALFTCEPYHLLLCCCALLPVSFPNWTTNSFYRYCCHA